MAQKWLSYILVSLIALQSAAVLADAQQYHQSNTDHLTLDSDNGSKPAGKNQTPDKDTGIPSTYQYDAHHCCHCLTLFFPVETHNNLDIMPLGQDASEYCFAYFSHLTAPDIRPPIT